MKRFAWIAVVVFLLTSCVPLYVPPVPDTAVLPSDLRVVNIEVFDDEFIVDLYGESDGWVSAQWFAPTGRELASHAVWLQAADESSTAVFPDVAPNAAYVAFSYGDEILRVFHK